MASRGGIELSPFTVDFIVCWYREWEPNTNSATNRIRSWSGSVPKISHAKVNGRPDPALEFRDEAFDFRPFRISSEGTMMFKSVMALARCGGRQATFTSPNIETPLFDPRKPPPDRHGGQNKDRVVFLSARHALAADLVLV